MLEKRQHAQAIDLTKDVIISEVMCVNCLNRGIVNYDVKTRLKDMLCEDCETVGAIILTGESTENIMEDLQGE